MFSVIHTKGTIKFFSILLIFILIIGLLPQLDVTANPVNQVDSPPAQLELLEGNQIDLVTTEGKSVTFELHLKSPSSGAFFMWEVAEPAANGGIDVAEANSQASISYIPAVGFRGMDNFAIRVNDTRGKSALVFFHVLVEDDAMFRNANEPPNPIQGFEASSNQLSSEKAVIPMEVDQQPLEPVSDRPNLRIAQGESVTIQMDDEPVKRITLDAIGAELMGLTWRVTKMPAQGEVFLNPMGASVEVIYKPDDGFRDIDTLALAAVDAFGNETETRLLFTTTPQAPESGLASSRSEMQPSGEIPVPNESTGPWIYVQKPTFESSAVYGYNWPASALVTLTVGNCILQNYANSGGFVYFYAYQCSGMDLGAGEVVTMQAGSTTKTHTIIDLGITGFDLSSRTISGYANDGPLTVTLDPWGVNESKTTTAVDGVWTATFVNEISLNEMVWLVQADADGDQTGLDDYVNMPTIEARPQSKMIHGSGWVAYAPLTVTIMGVQDSLTADWGGQFDYYPGYDLTPGLPISVTDGRITKSMVVGDITVTSVDLSTKTVSGTSSSSPIYLEKNGNPPETIIPDETGNWSFTYSSLLPGEAGRAYVEDMDYDRTISYWNAPSPYFLVYLSDGRLEGWGWPVYGEVTAALTDNPDLSWSKQADSNGIVSFYFREHPGFDVTTGDTIRLTSGSYMREHTVIDLRATGFDLPNKTISGVANPGMLRVMRWDTGEQTEPIADGSRNWSTTFTNDLLLTSYGELSQADDDGDRTYVRWSIPNPMLTIEKTYRNLISGRGWPAEPAKAIYVDDVLVATLDDGFSNFDYESTDPLPEGTVVRVVCGTYIKEHTVIDLRMTSYDLPGNSISGVANSGLLTISRWDDYENTEATADSNGLWSTVFSTSLVKGAYGYLSQSDPDGDKTYVRWEIPGPHVYVDIWRDHISSSGWKPGETVTISLNGIVQATATASIWGYIDIDISSDIVGGDTVLLSNGTDSVTHVVKDISITWYDEEADTIWGTAEPGEIRIDAHDSDGWDYFTIPVGEDRNWLADFTGLTNIGPGTQINLSQHDENANSTEITWIIQAISMSVFLQNNDISTQGWPDNTEVTLSINGTEVETRTISGSSWFHPQQTLLPNDEVIISSNLVTITHVIRNISVTSWNFTADTVSGKAAANTEVTVEVTDGSNWWNQDAVANSSGDWTANFAGITDIEPGIDGWVNQYDEEGNSTHRPFQIRNPYFYVDHQSNEVFGDEWSPNTTITVTVDGQTWLTQSNSGGYFGMNLSPYDIMPGVEIQVTDGIDTRTHSVRNLSVTSIDVEGDILTGTANPGELEVMACTSGYCYSKYPVADGEGIWTEDFTDLTDITIDTYGYLYQFDSQGNYTTMYWYIPNPFFYVYLSNNEVAGDEWSPNSTITVTIGSESWETQSDSYGEFDLYISQFQIIPGNEVQVSDGTSSRTHIVKNLSVTNINVDANTLAGTANPGGLEVMACTSGYCYDKYPVANGDGIWTENFTGTTDITVDTYGWIYQFDDQGNYTVIYWYVPNPYVYVYPLTNIIYGNEWSPNATITISTMGQSWTVRSDSGGWFRLSTDSFDILPGQTITVTDGYSTRTHKVRNLSVTSIDVGGDVLTGTADPGQLRVRVCPGCYSKYTEANSNGNWTEDFTDTTDITPESYGYLYQYDLEGNYTVIYWYQPDPVIRANLSNDSIFGDRWPAFVEVSISVDGVTLGTETSDSYGSFNIYLDDDLVVGQEIVITSPEYSTITYTTQAIAFEGYDITEDTVWGTAEAGTVFVQACYVDGGYLMCYQLDSTVTSGAWLVDFTGTFDLVPGSDGSAFIYDENDNSTEVSWFIPNPKFSVYLQDNVVFGSLWPSGSTIDVSISGVLETFHTVAGENGFWVLFIEDVTIIPGMIVTVTGTIPDSIETIQREHLVRNIAVTNMDYGLDTVEGTAESGVLLDVFVIDASHYYGYQEIVLSDSVGHWIADFSSTIDIIPGFSVQVAQDDDDGDSTVAYWQPELFSIYLPQIRK